MNKKALKVLEYNKIIEMLKDQASSQMGRERLGKLLPETEIHRIKDGLAETSEAVQVIVKKGALPLGEIYDIAGALHFAKKGGTLTMRQLLQVLYNMKVTANVVSFVKGDIEDIPIIKEMVRLLAVFPQLADRIDRCILSEDEMADSASPELKNIRRSIARQNEAIRRDRKSVV